MTPPRLVAAGATGNVGRRVVARWCARGGEVVVLSRDPARARRDLASTSGDVRVLPTPTTLDEARTLSREIGHANALVACTPTSVAVFEPLLHLAEIAAIERVVLLSSTRRFSRVLDESVGRVRRAEAFARRACPQATILRPTMIIGGPRDNNVARIAGWARRWGWLPVMGDGRALIQPVWAEDVAAAALAALEHPATRGRAYTLAGPRPMATRSLLAAIARREGLDPATRLVRVPRWIVVGAAWIFAATGRRAMAASLRRALEDKAFAIASARHDFGFAPHALSVALKDR